jgi:hypothetical protein
VAETVETVEADTAVLPMLTVAVVAPDCTVTLAGVWVAALLSDSVMKAPPEGAGPVRVTVAVEEAPPTTVVGFRVNDFKAGGFSVSVADFVTPLKVPEIVTVVWEPTALVETVNVAVVAPAATVTLAGVDVEELLSLKGTVRPPAGAGALNVTVPVELVPPVTLVGFIVSELNAAGATPVKFTPVTFAPLTFTTAFKGENTNPFWLGVIV